MSLQKSMNGTGQGTDESLKNQGAVQKVSVN